MSNDYEVLVEQIQKCEILQNAIVEMSERSRVLNLIQPGWNDLLSAYAPFKAHEENTVRYSKGRNCVEDKAHVKTIILPQNQFNVLVAGLFSLGAAKTLVVDDEDSFLGDSSSFVTRSCEPLTKIGEVMRENKQQKLHDGARLFPETCDPVMCHSCMFHHNKHKIPISKRNWCLLTTRVYDGKHLKHEFKSRLEKCLKKSMTFLGILHVKIYSRTTFGEDSYKIGGTIKEMIIFQETTLRKCDLSLMIDAPEAFPSIQYPPDGDPGEE